MKHQHFDTIPCVTSDDFSLVLKLSIISRPQWSFLSLPSDNSCFVAVMHWQSSIIRECCKQTYLLENDEQDLVIYWWSADSNVASSVYLLLVCSLWVCMPYLVALIATCFIPTCRSAHHCNESHTSPLWLVPSQEIASLTCAVLKPE